MNRLLITTLSMVLTGLLLSPAFAASSSWVVALAQENSPLQMATLSGIGTVGQASFPVALEVRCQPGWATVQLALRVPDSIPDWDVAPFEGQQGLGMRRRLLSMVMKGSRFVERYRVSGERSGQQTFTFRWHPSEAFMKRMPATATHLVVKIKSARRRQPMLKAHFDLPTNAASIREAVASCLAGK